MDLTSADESPLSSLFSRSFPFPTSCSFLLLSSRRPYNMTKWGKGQGNTNVSHATAALSPPLCVETRRANIQGKRLRSIHTSQRPERRGCAYAATQAVIVERICDEIGIRRNRKRFQSPARVYWCLQQCTSSMPTYTPESVNIFDTRTEKLVQKKRAHQEITTAAETAIATLEDTVREAAANEKKKNVFPRTSINS